MKNTIRWGVVWLICSGPQFLDAQAIYGKVGVGYRFGYPSMRIDQNTTSNSVYISPGNVTNTEEHQGVYGTFGKGTTVEGAVGIKEENLGFEIGISYLFKSSITAGSNRMWTNDYKKSYSITDFFTHENTMLSISPSLVLYSDVGIYGRAGAVIGFPKYVSKEQFVNTVPARTERNWTIEYSATMALGYTVAMGWTVHVEGIAMFVEGDIVSLTSAPARSELTEDTWNGVDQPSTIYGRKTRYEDTFTHDTNTPFDPNSEQVSVKKKFPYSSVGLKAGILIGL